MTIKCLDELPSATPEAIFRQAANHLLSQKRRAGESSANGFTCTWVDTQGNRCAIGCFMDDNDLEVACLLGWTLPSEFPVWDKLTRQQQCLLQGVLTIHDADPVEAWPHELKQLAARLNLAC